MNLFSQTFKYLFVSIFFIISIWSVILYYNLLYEIYDSIDDGLDNYKLLILQKADAEPATLLKTTFDESNYAIRPVAREKALTIRDTYQDTLMYMPFENDLEPVRMLTTAFFQSGSYYELKIISSMVEEDDLINNLFWSVVALFLILIMSILTVSNIVLKRIWQPFYRLLNHLRAFRLESSHDMPAIRTDTKEFQELNQAIEVLISNSRQAYENQKRFTENAAHELQTPLATIIHYLELLLENGSLRSEDVQKIAKVLQMAEKLSKMNKSLLLLTKIENRQFPTAEEVDFERIIRQNADVLSDLAAFRNKEITITVSGRFVHPMDSGLAGILVDNLIKNAIVHSKNGNTIGIEVFEGGFSVKNTGDTLPLDKEKILSRFYKSSESGSGMGLGLALVEAICRIGGLSISYEYDEGHLFKISKK